MQQEHNTTVLQQKPKPRRYTLEERMEIERKRKKRKAERHRNQMIFLALCTLVLVLVILGLIKLVMLAVGAFQAADLPEVEIPEVEIPLVSTDSVEEVPEYDDVTYDVSEYVYDPDDVRMILVNTNLPLSEDYTVETAVADDASGMTLEVEAAEQYRAMAAAALVDGISLTLIEGYHDADTQEMLFTQWYEYYQDQGNTDEDAYTLAQTMVGAANASEHQTGYGADILSEDYTSADLGFVETAAFAWLERYAAEYGFILRYDESKQMITGHVYVPWHWRYVGVENAKAVVESGLSLEEFIELNS